MLESKNGSLIEKTCTHLNTHTHTHTRTHTHTHMQACMYAHAYTRTHAQLGVVFSLPPSLARWTSWIAMEVFHGSPDHGGDVRFHQGSVSFLFPPASPLALRMRPHRFIFIFAKGMPVSV